MKGRYLPLLIVVICCFFSSVLFAQRVEPLPKGKIEEQYQHLYDGSRPYQIYKVVPQTWLETFYKNVQDTLKARESSLIDNQKTITSQKNKIAALQAEDTAKQEQINTLQKEKDTLVFLGIPLNKAAYHVFVWTVIGALFAGLLFFLGRFRYANAITRKIKAENQELMEKVEDQRKRMLEKEQQLRRQLQDEINKRLES
ncbi:MAG: hypothetical protein R2824_00740 [Saprospiraceae bacterium]|nr:hypothetical protein [Lewinella sp.]